MENRKIYGRVAVQMIPVALMAWLCIKLSTIPMMQKYGFSLLTIAIVLGIVLGNMIPPQHVMRLAEGLQFSKARLLRLGIIL